MSTTLDVRPQASWLRGFAYARPAALCIALAVPLGLLHAFVLAEICIAITDLLFVAEMARTRNVEWAKQPWFAVAILWWAWTIFCSGPYFKTAGFTLSFLEALVIIRLILFTVALQSWLLTTANARRAAWLVLALSCLWIGVESWQQYITGRNIFGDPRWGDGSLTGPFWKPRAGQLYAHLLFTALLPPVLALFARPGRFWQVAGVALAILGVVTSILIGQRMGTLLTGLGLATAALFIPQLRRAALLAAVIAVIVLVATPYISPPTYGKLVGETSRNISHFWLSPYGELFTRATVMGLQSPWHGWGYNGFRAFCPEPQFGGGLPALGIASTSLALAACNLHPQNYYIQAFCEAGFPGLILFVLMNLIWLQKLFSGLWRSKNPLRVGLFIGVLTYSWPLASTDAFPALYMLGWFFLLLGLGLAHAHIRANPITPDIQNA
jgi:O-antigen ligase